MSVSENFDRKFNKSMRGYNPEEVDAALDALLRYCDELEDANREFEIANNDLIDEKNELGAYVASLESEKEALAKKNAELSSGMAKIESVYNGYREKFGEARDLVTNAKSSATEILARAKAKAEILTEEAAKKREIEMKKLDIEIEKRRALIEELDIAYNKFNAEIKATLESMINNVDSFHVMPILPEGLPERVESFFEIAIAPGEPTKKEPPKEEAPKQSVPEPIKEAQAEEIYEEIAEETTEVEDTESSVSFEPESSALGPVWRESAGGERISEVSIMKSSLDEINQKVLKKKSTPHI